MRLHRVTHPILGVRVWSEIKAARPEGQCSWCHEPVAAGRRTRCGKEECSELIWRASSWTRVKNVAMRRDRCKCVLCFAPAAEVDHIIPVMLEGTGDLENVRSLCHACHRSETSRLRMLKQNFRARLRLAEPEGVAPSDENRHERK